MICVKRWAKGRIGFSIYEYDEIGCSYYLGGWVISSTFHTMDKYPCRISRNQLQRELEDGTAEFVSLRTGSASNG